MAKDRPCFLRVEDLSDQEEVATPARTGLLDDITIGQVRWRLLYIGEKRGILMRLKVSLGLPLLKSAVQK